MACVGNYVAERGAQMEQDKVNPRTTGRTRIVFVSSLPVTPHVKGERELLDTPRKVNFSGIN